MSVTREQIMTALFALVCTAPGFQTQSRRIKLFSDVGSGEKPALFMYERPEKITNGNNKLTITELNVDLFIYIDAGKDQSSVPITVLNPLIDALASVLQPAAPFADQTLGGLVSRCYIDGQIMKEPGDLDGDGIAIIPVKILATL